MYRISMKDMEFYGYIGCNRDEKENGQVFIVTCDMYFDDLAGAHTDRLEDTVNYAQVYDLIRDIVHDSDCNLIEHVADQIANEVLGKFLQVTKVEVSLSKPGAPIDGIFSSMEAGAVIER